MNKTSDQIALQIVKNLREALNEAHFTVVLKEEYDLYRDGELEKEETILEAPHFTTHDNGTFKQFVVAMVENGKVHGLGMYEDEGETCTVPVSYLTAEEVLALAPYLPHPHLVFPLYHVVAIEGERVTAIKTYTEECPDIANTFLKFVEEFEIEGDRDEMLMDGEAISNTQQRSVVLKYNCVSARQDKKVKRHKSYVAMWMPKYDGESDTHIAVFDWHLMKKKLKEFQFPAHGVSSINIPLSDLVGEYLYLEYEVDFIQQRVHDARRKGGTFGLVSVTEEEYERAEVELEEVGEALNKTVEVTLYKNGEYFLYDPEELKEGTLVKSSTFEVDE